MNLLYLSCHEILEWDELRLFTDLGHTCYSLGAFTKPNDGSKRPGIPGVPDDPHWQELALQFDRTNLHPEQVEGKDAVIVMDGYEGLNWVEGNWPLFRALNKPVIWRSIGQSHPEKEDRLGRLRSEGLIVVRYSPREATIARYAGADATIRFAKNPADFLPWTGTSGEVITFVQSLSQRGADVGSHWLPLVTHGLPRRFYGPGNDDIPAEWNGGLVDYRTQLEVLAGAGAYAWFGSWPAAYTLTLMEALMAGVPVVAPGPGWGNATHEIFRDQSTYEGHELIEDGVSGFWSDDPNECHKRLRDLLADRDLAAHISDGARKRGEELFSTEHIGPQWQALLEEVVR